MSGARVKFVCSIFGAIWIISTFEGAQVIVGGVSVVKGGCRSMKAKSFGWKDVKDVSGCWNCLGLRGRRERCMSE